MKKFKVKSLVLCLFGLSLGVEASTSAATLSLFPLEQVQLTGGPLKHAQETNINYLLSLEADKLLAPYRREAGLKLKQPSYGNWENTGLDGHIGGHYLTALSLAYAASQDERLLHRLIYTLNELEQVQKANGNGYIGGIPDGEVMWNEVASGKIDADLFSMNKRWVPWYNIHKMFAGLRDAYQIAHLPKAKELLKNYGEWVKWLVKDLSDEQIQRMLITEHGGPNEVFADMAEIFDDQEYVRLAEAFSQKSILEPLTHKQDKLSGLHANTQIPKVVGFKRVADLTQNEEWQQAAEFFWDTVVNHRSAAIGGNSVKEHFHALDNFEAMVSDIEGPETCNTYNMQKLSKMLYLTSSDTQYVDYYERAMYNHILSSQHPEHGGLVYFTSMRPGHYRVYSESQHAMWCCVGSGIENHSKYAELIYAKDAQNGVYVNLFVPSKLSLKEAGVTLYQETQFPEQETSTIRVEGEGEFKLHLREPAWLAGGKMSVAINGKPVKDLTGDDNFFVVEKEWRSGDKVTFTLPMENYVEPLPENIDHYAVLHGPVVLAAQVNPFPGEQLNFVADDSRMGHIASGPMCPPEALPVILDDPKGFVEGLEAVDGEPLTFVAKKQLSNPLKDPVVLVPFYKLHDTRYQVYWPNTSKEELEAFRNRAAIEAEKRRQLEAITVDKVAPGEQQPESDHFYKGEQSEAGVHMGRHWRHTRAWFSYELTNHNLAAKKLRISYFGLDGGRSFSITLNGHLVAQVELKGDKGNGFFDVDYELPKALLDKPEQKLELKFIADEGSVAGGIYGVRLLKK